MILREDDQHDLSQAIQRAPGASHSRGRTVLVENLSYTTSLSGLLRQFEGFHLQEHAATLLEGVRVPSFGALCSFPGCCGQCLTRVSIGVVQCRSISNVGVKY